jgi:hypothetical protein
MVGKSNNVLVEYDYQNIILIDPNKLISDEGRAEERLVDHEDMVMYANLTCKLIPRTKLAIGADIQNSIREVTLAEINFLRQQTTSGKNFLDNTYTDEITGKNTLNKQGLNQPKNTSVEVPLKDGGSQSIITQETSSQGKTGSFNTGLLGITNITIKNSTSFVPTVTIEFEDVRGRALFERGDQSPYAAFFHMPYPIFYLTIKGYFGKAVKYPLQLHTFNARFNTMTGNYQVTCVFYSYKYGILADMPMGTLYSLPFMYKAEYDVTNPTKTVQTPTTREGQSMATLQTMTSNQPSSTVTKKTSKGQQKLFEVYSDYKSKNLIPKSFPELNIQQLKNKIEVLEDLIKSELGKQDMGSLTDADKFAEDLKNYRLDVYSSGNDSWFDKYIDNEFYIYDTNRIKIFFFKKEIASDLGKKDAANKDLQSIMDNYNSKLNSNKTYGKDGKFNGESFTINNQINPQVLNYGEINMESGIDYEYSYLQINGRKPNEIELSGFAKDVKTFLQDTNYVANLLSTRESFFFDGQSPKTNSIIKKGFVNYISDMLGKDGLQRKKELIEKKLTEIIANILESNKNGLGFRPTIRNISAIIFANAEAFLRLLDDVHTDAWQVRNEIARKRAILKNPGANSTENKDFIQKLSETGENAEYPVYPWPQFFSEKKDDKGNTRYEITYPGDNDVIDLTEAFDYRIWPEVEFEEEFIRSIIERNNPPLPYTDNSTDEPNRLSLNASEFPIGFRPFSIRQSTKFIYEMWERFLFAAYYNGIYDDSITPIISEMEVQNIEQSGLESDPFLLNVLKNINFDSRNIELILANISNQGTGESFQLYDRGIFVTPYIKNALENSFVILGEEYFNQKKTNPGISLTDKSLENLNRFITGTSQNTLSGVNILGQSSNFLKNRDITDLYPYQIQSWNKNNLSNYIKNKDNVTKTNKVLVYNTEKKLIANFLNSSQTKKEKRPYTNISMYLGDLPKVQDGAIVTINNNSLGNFYNNRFNDPITNKGQLITEATLEYKKYDNLLVSAQTTSILNTPIFINALQLGVENYLNSNFNEQKPPYIEAAYVFLNSLPLATLKEKYVTIDGTNLTDLDYIFACFKKHSGLHKIPYAWILRYGSIWHRYKRWIEKGDDFLKPVWKNFDYKKNWDPTGSGRTSYNLGITDVELEGYRSKNNLEISLGIYPQVLDDFNIFYQSEQVYTGFTDTEIKKSFENNTFVLISGSSVADKFFTTGYNLSNTAETLNVRTFTVLADTVVPKKGKYVLPSFGSNINQIYNELFSPTIIGTKQYKPVSGNTAVRNGSVRIFHGVPHYGYFDIDNIDMPKPTQYIKKILPDRDRQSAASLGSEKMYSSIEEIFSVFDKKSLDQFEIFFLKWCKTTFDSDGSLPITNDQFEDATNLDSKEKTVGSTYNNFQRLFSSLMFIANEDLDLNNLSQFEKIKKIQDIQYRNVGNILSAFFEYDVVIKNGNPRFFDRRVFLSLVNREGNQSNNVIQDPINFGFYGDQFSSVVPTISTSGILLENLKKQTPNSELTWKSLETNVGFSTIPNLIYASSGSNITDFFVDLDISFNVKNVEVLAPLIKIYATQKTLNPSYNKDFFLNDLNSFLTKMNGFRDKSFDIFSKSMNNKLKNVKPIKRIRGAQSPLQGNQTKVEIWEMFKAMNDKWVAGNNYPSKTLFEDVLFLDRASRDIGDKVFIDIYKLKAQLTDVNMDGRIMGFILDFIQENNFVAMSVPSYVNFYNAQEVSDITPKVQGTTEFANDLFGTHLTVDLKNSSPKLVCFYADKVSEHPEIENSEYRWGSDSFDLRRFSDNPLIENQIGKNDWARSNKVVGFNVDVGIRNQNIFTNVILAQDPGKATAESLRILDLMASSASGKQTATQNVSLFNLYKSRSYTCSVESMGNAMIQPTMYFNLRHVPMFNGPYMILNVEHSIQPGSFRTTFSGVRQSKYSLPLIQDFIQNIYKIYLSEFLKDVKNEITKDSEKNKTAYSVTTDKIDNAEEKSKTISDCKPTNSNNANNFKLTNDPKLTGSKTLTENEIKYLVSNITDVRTRYMVFGAIYMNSYSSGNYYVFGNNLLGFSLDNQIKGSLSSYMTNEYVCVDVGGNKTPLAIFKDNLSAINFGNDLFKNISEGLNGKIEEFSTQLMFLLTKYWQTTISDDKVVNNIINSSQGQTIQRKLSDAGTTYLRLFPDDKGKTFGTIAPTPTPVPQSDNDQAIFDNAKIFGRYYFRNAKINRDGSMSGDFYVLEAGVSLSKEYTAKLNVSAANGQLVKIADFNIKPNQNGGLGSFATKPDIISALEMAQPVKTYRNLFTIEVSAPKGTMSYSIAKVIIPLDCPDEGWEYRDIIEVAEWDSIKDDICCECYSKGYTGGKIIWDGKECSKTGC